MKVLFMGTPDYAESILNGLIQEENIDVVAVYTQPDKPVGRKQIMTPPVVKKLALQNSIDVYQPSSLRDEDTVKQLLKIECDYIVVAAYGQILPKDILEHAPCINLHASVLPKYRGASPIQQTLLNDDATTGVTAMLMDEGLDTGDILKIESIAVDPNEMVESLFERLTKLASSLTIDVLQNYDHLLVKKQDSNDATHCKKILKKDGEIKFESAQEVFNKYRAYTPWPGIFLASGLKIKKMALENKMLTSEAGKILEVASDSIVVGCNSGSVRIYSVQAPSKKEVGIISYINGQRLGCEDFLS